MKSSRQLPLLKPFILYVKEFLELETLPQITLSSKLNGAKEMGSFGGYTPYDKSIKLNIHNRHQADVFRTLAHELNHYKQDILNQLTDESGKTGHPHENECNAVAAVILRNFAKAHPDMFTPNEI